MIYYGDADFHRNLLGYRFVGLVEVDHKAFRGWKVTVRNSRGGQRHTYLTLKEVMYYL